ncbi:MAG TPA: hypothetical protein VD999_02405 [Vitreimonas sp.]|nr:hypothetical protein [Vitreimonas sp.]
MSLFSFFLAAPPANVFGKVSPPPGVQLYSGTGGNQIGILAFMSTLIRVATVIAGIWVMFQFILAGYEYITASGDASAHNKVRERLTMSVIGLILIVTSYTVAALIGLIVFDDAGFILNPIIKGP